MATLDHKLYPAAKLEEADAVAWVATAKTGPLVMYPFKFKPVEAVEVRVKILHTSICHSDIMTIRQSWGPCSYPACPGHEIVGAITLVGASVKDFHVGEIVGVSTLRHSCSKCKYCLLGQTNLCDERIFLYGQHFGGFCTHIQLEADWVFHLPKGFKSIEGISPLLCAGITVFAPIKRYQKIGARCAILGIGGLGHLAIQYANKLGMHVTAFTTRTDNFQSLRDLGAGSVEHSTDLALLAKNEGKYDLVISTIFIDNQELYKRHQRLTAPGGVYVMIGVPDVNSVYKVDTQYVIDNEIKVAGTIVGSIEAVKEMLEFSALYDIQSSNQYFEFQDFNKALARAESGPKYRVVVNVNNWAKANGFDK